MTTQTLTSTQTTWLTARGLEAHLNERGDIAQVQPIGANVWRAPYVRVQCWGPESFDVVSVYVCGSLGMPSPAGRVVSKHTTLKAALAALTCK